MTSVDFVRRIAKQTLKINHEPDIDIRSDKVTLTLTTHDQGGITEKDISVAPEVRRGLLPIFGGMIRPGVEKLRLKKLVLTVSAHY